VGHHKDAGAIATPTEKLLLEAGEVRWWRLDGANGYSVLVSHGRPGRVLLVTGQHIDSLLAKGTYKNLSPFER
jgi:hypothetical protein